MPSKKPRYSIIIDDDMLEEIDDYRYDNRFSSRAKATERLIMLGLQAYEAMSDEEKKAEREYVKEQSKG
jgi:metal-responsive CopG/Arc/MetJ family transcriptional regulator